MEQIEEYVWQVENGPNLYQHVEVGVPHSLNLVYTFFELSFFSESDCGDPGTPANGSTFGDTYTVGSTVNHTCNMGFELVGSSQRECLVNASWSGSLPTCESKSINAQLLLVTRRFHIVIDCGDPGRPVDGTTTGTSTTFRSVVNHTCNEGFLLSGAAQRVCLSSAMWSAPLPNCTGKSPMH